MTAQRESLRLRVTWQLCRVLAFLMGGRRCVRQFDQMRVQLDRQVQIHRTLGSEREDA